MTTNPTSVPPALSFACRHRYADGFELDAAFESRWPVTALFGPSGSGKTTILELVAGLLAPASGSIRLGDAVLTDTTRGIFLPPERRRIGMLFQERRLFPHLTVRANLAYGTRRRIHRTDDKAGTIDASRAVDVLEISDLLDRYPRTLSGGQQQRVALARALASNPDLLLLDEPLNGVEESLRDRIADYLARVAVEFAIPMILVSHHRELVDRLAARVISVEEGRVVGEYDLAKGS